MFRRIYFQTPVFIYFTRMIKITHILLSKNVSYIITSVQFKTNNLKSPKMYKSKQKKKIRFCDISLFFGKSSPYN